MAYNLMEEAWLHVEYGDGFRRWIAPWQVAEESEHGLPTAFCSGRPDLDGAMTEFIIGLVQTVFCPTNRRDWEKLWQNPPDANALRDRLTAENVKSCFELLGDGHCFMQDEDLLADAKPMRVETLLMDTPGQKTLDENKDHFVKRKRIAGLCPRCLAQTVFCLQTYASGGGGGGGGYHTSVRGGGPLTTVIVGDDLLNTAILNVTPQVPFSDLSTVFPWMTATRTSEKGSGVVTTPEDVHALQAFWGMPRRIRLGTARGEAECDICGEMSEWLVKDYRRKTCGTDYGGGWRHPSSPHQIKDNVPIAIHVQPGGIRYHAWLGAIVPSRDGRLQPARTIMEIGSRLADESGFSTSDSGFRVRAFGYDMDKMKARCWYEGEFPILRVAERIRTAFGRVSEVLVTIASSGAEALRKAILSSRDPDGHKTKSSSGELSQVGAFWSGTEAGFYRALNRAHRRLLEGGTVDDVYRDWLAVVRKAALRLFDEAADVAFLAEHGDPRAVVKAREKLGKSLSWTKWWREKLEVEEAQEEGRDAG